MKTAITVSILTAGLSLAAAAPARAAYELFVTIEGATRNAFRLDDGRARVEIEERGGELRGSLRQAGRNLAREVSFALDGCSARSPEEFDGGRAAIRKRPGRPDELRVRHPRLRDCFLVGTPPSSPRAGRPELTTPTRPPLPGGKHQPGLPDQGIVATLLPDLEIESVAAATGGAAKLTAIVRNGGPGASGATRLTLRCAADGGKLLSSQAPVPPLAPGATAPVQIAAPCEPLVEATLEVDDPPKVEESDEENNGFDYTADR